MDFDYDELTNIDDDYDDFNSDDYVEITDADTEFATDIFNIIQSLIDNEITEINENFISSSQLNRHFYKHCLVGKNKSSKASNVYYDFKYVNQYKNHEEHINSLVQQTKYIIPSLLDTELVCKYFRKLFEGNITLYFPTCNQFYNETGLVQIGLHSYCTNLTNNYPYNTIDLIIMSPRGETITIYPVDAYYLQTKFNNIIDKHNKNNVKLHFNND